MRLTTEIRERLRALFHRSREEDAMEAELRFHIEMQTEENLRRGMEPEEARREAALAFGGVERVKEEVREARGVRPLENLARDLRYALRTLRRSPGFAAAAVLTLALGIGALTATYALVDSILIEPLPYPGSDRLVAIEHAAPGAGVTRAGISGGLFLHYRANARSVEGLALYTERTLTLSGGDGDVERVSVTMAGPELFRTLGVRPELGRLFTEADGRRGFMDGRWPIPVLLSHRLWESRYGGDRAIIGRMITINDLPREVVGVLPEGFGFPHPTTDIWRLDMPEPGSAMVSWLDYEAVARLRPHVTPAQAEADLTRILPSVVGEYRDATPELLARMRIVPRVVPLKDAVVGDVGAVLWILLGGMSFLLLVACANIANLFLLRGEHRSREVAVRAALGAERADLVRLFLSESLLLSGGGALLGLLLAWWTLHALVAFAPVELPRLQEVKVDGRAAAFAAAIALLAALVFGSVSLARQSRSALAPRLKGGGRGGAGGREGRRTRNLLVGGQVALALTLLVGSALMAQSFARLTAVDPGFDPDSVLTVEIGLPYRQAANHEQIYDAVVERVRALPGVTAAAMASSVPLTGEVWSSRVRASDRPVRPEEKGREVALDFFTPGYLQTMRTPVVEGIGFAPGERVEAAHPVLLSASLARRLFPGESALGKPVRRLQSSGEEDPRQPDYTVAGVVADVRETSLRADPTEIVYIPVIAPPVEPSVVPTDMSLVIRSAAPPLTLVASVRSAIHEVAPELALGRVRSMESIVRRSTARESFLTLLLLVAAASSLFLGLVGIYGVVAYAVRRREQEIGIRVALGATAGQVTRLVLREWFSILAAGLAVGTLTALASTRALRSMLFEVSPTDPLTLGVVAVLLAAVALVASLVPARRAARTDPMVALRAE